MESTWTGSTSRRPRHRNGSPDARTWRGPGRDERGDPGPYGSGTGRRCRADLRFHHRGTPGSPFRPGPESLHAKARSFLRRERNLSDDINSLVGHERVLAAFAPLVETHELPRDFEMIGVVFERRNRLARDMLRREVERLTAGNFRFIEQQIEGRPSLRASSGFPESDSTKVRALISSAGHRGHGLPPAPQGQAFRGSLCGPAGGAGRPPPCAAGLSREQMERFFQENAAELMALPAPLPRPPGPLRGAAELRPHAARLHHPGMGPARGLDRLRTDLARISSARSSCGRSARAPSGSRPFGWRTRSP